MKRTVLTLMLLGSTAAGGCGEDAAKPNPGANAASSPVTVLKLKDTSTPGRWTFDKKKLTAKAGRVRIEFTNPSDLGHNVRVQTGKRCCFARGFKDLGGTPVVGGLAKDSGMTVTASLELKPGRYWFLCANAGHWQAGQRGSLVVR